MQLTKKILRKNIIKFLAEENERNLIQQRRRLKRLLESKEDYLFSRNVLHEGIMDTLSKTLGGSIDSVKGYFVNGLLEKLGIENENAKGIITNIVEQFGINDLIGFMTGSYGCESMTEDIVKGIVEFAIEDGIESIVGFIDELDIPVIDGLLQKFVGGEGMLDNAEEESLVNAITEKIYPVIGDKIEEFICDLGFLGSEEEAEEAVNEIFDFNIYDATQKISLYNKRRKKLLIKQNE
jgi:hypothetical protein